MCCALFFKALALKDTSVSFQLFSEFPVLDIVMLMK